MWADSISEDHSISRGEHAAHYRERPTALQLSLYHGITLQCDTMVSQYHGELISKWEKKGWRSCMWVWGKQLEVLVGPMVHSCTIIELSCKGLAHGEAGSLIYESTNLDSAALIHTTALFTFELHVCWTFFLSQKCTEKFTLKLKSAINDYFLIYSPFSADAAIIC